MEEVLLVVPRLCVVVLPRRKYFVAGGGVIQFLEMLLSRLTLA